MTVLIPFTQLRFSLTCSPLPPLITLSKVGVYYEKGASAFFSFFVLDWYRGPGTPIDQRYEVNHPLEGYEGVAVYDDKRPEHIIAYSTSCIERMASDARLRIKRLIPGYWSNAHKWSLNEQDLVLLEAV